MEVYAWCIMTNHVHLIFRSIDEYKPELMIGDLKRFTSNQIVKAIINNPRESRKDWFLEQFQKVASKSSNVNRHQFWQHDNQPIELWSNKVIFEKLNYIHNNPVVEGLVNYPEDYVYSSARDYSGEKGLLDDVIILR